MKILGISAYYHDSAAAITVNGEVIAAAQEERFTRKKHDPSFPAQAVRYCLEETGLKIDELDAVVFYDKPFLKFERLLQTYYGFSPKGLRSFIKAVPIWVKEKLFLKKAIKQELEKLQPYDKRQLKLLFPEHHLSHAASAYYPSPYDDAAILTVDGVGEWATASISHGKGKDIELLRELRFPHSLGLLYSSFTYFLGFKVNSGEYKMMGLAPYGNKNSEDYKRYIDTIKTTLIDISYDGSIKLNQKYFNYATGLRMVVDKKWEKLLNLPKRDASEEIDQRHMDLALAIQVVTEEVVILMAAEAKRLTGCNNLCLAGGVALNCVANGKLIGEKIFDHVWIQPAAGDAGGALGAALAAHHIYYDQPLSPKNNSDNMKGSYLGPQYYDNEIEKIAKQYKAKYVRCTDNAELSDRVSHLLNDENVIGWFQGRMEFGPRALGHRSIIADARSTGMQLKLNLKIKYRESFRPFAPSVLSDRVSDYFDLKSESPYMLVVRDINQQLKYPLPDDYHQKPLMEKLRINRSKIPAVTHVDFSGRIQTVDGIHNREYYNLIKAFEKLTGDGIVINTSFNVRGEPIVCTPEDAYRCFMRTEMDYLVINNYIFKKTDQPKWSQKDEWREEFALD